jgi:hypothetical protein
MSQLPTNKLFPAPTDFGADPRPISSAYDLTGVSVWLFSIWTFWSFLRRCMRMSSAYRWQPYTTHKHGQGGSDSVDEKQSIQAILALSLTLLSLQFYSDIIVLTKPYAHQILSAMLSGKLSLIPRLFFLGVSDIPRTSVHQIVFE